MRRLLRISPFTLVLVAVLTVVVVGAIYTTRQIGQQIGHAASPNLPPSGVGAITPSRPGQVPAFTASDVRAYLARHPFQTTTAGLVPAITEIVFITREQAEAAMGGESLAGQVAPGGLVCYVELAGPFDALQGHGGPPPLGAFVLPGTPTPTPAPPPQEITQNADMVFDASTGNLLVVGYGN